MRRREPEGGLLDMILQALSIIVVAALVMAYVLPSWNDGLAGAAVWAVVAGIIMLRLKRS